MKLLGGLLVFLACAGSGVWRAALIRRRVRTLGTLDAALALLRGEICDRLTPLPEAVAAAGGAAGETGAFFSALSAASAQIGDEPFSTLWQTAAEKNLCSLRTEELAAAAALGGVLGRYDAESQRKAIDACRDKLTAAYALAAPDARSAMRAAAGAGAAVGLILTITLL